MKPPSDAPAISISLLEKNIRVCTAEDLIVSKILSTRAKDRGDDEPVVQKQADALNNAYIENWPAQFKEALADSAQIPVLKGKLPNRVLGLVLEWASLHRNELRADWERARKGETLEPIQPLE